MENGNVGSKPSTGNHLRTYSRPHGGEFATVATAWFKWQLKGDREAATMFTGEAPGLGKMAGWSFERKNLR